MRVRRFDVVVISRNEGHELRLTIENLEDTLPSDSRIVVVDDGSTDGSPDTLSRRRGGRVRLRRAAGLGVARARNLGARLTGGDAVIFADAHLRLPPGWWQPLVELIADPRVGAAAPAMSTYDFTRTGYGLRFKDPAMEVEWIRKRRRDPFPAPILPGACLAMSRKVFEATGGWDPGLLHRGNIDNEQSVRLWLLGYELLVAPRPVVGHLFRKRAPYPSFWPEYLHNRLRLAFLHFKPERLQAVLRALQHYSGFGEAMAMVVDSDITARRRQLISRRKRNDDWYFERFGLSW